MIVVKTGSGKIRWFANILGTEAEDCFLRSLSVENASLELLVCMWSDGSIDLPSLHFRKLLLEADQGNEQTLMLLQLDSGHIERTIGWSMP